MKKPSVGQIVWHYLDRGCEPAAAIITAVNPQGLVALSIFRPGMHNADVADGVPHVLSDRPTDVGYWDWPCEKTEAVKVA